MDKGQQNYERARARVQALKDFYAHATAYVLVNIGLFVINLFAGGSWWFFWPLVFWGIGLGVHALNVFVLDGRLGQDWEKRKTRELMDQGPRR
jgi:hypothetical protein